MVMGHWPNSPGNRGCCYVFFRALILVSSTHHLGVCGPTNGAAGTTSPASPYLGPMVTGFWPGFPTFRGCGYLYLDALTFATTQGGVILRDTSRIFLDLFYKLYSLTQNNAELKRNLFPQDRRQGRRCRR